MISDNNRLLKTQNGKDFIKALSVLAEKSYEKDWERDNLHFFALKRVIIAKTERYKKNKKTCDTFATKVMRIFWSDSTIRGAGFSIDKINHWMKKEKQKLED